MGVPFSRPVFLLAGTLYPGYQTFKALEAGCGGTRSESGGGVDAQRQWLAYWVCHAALHGAEFIVGGGVRGVLPLYNVIRLALVAWLIHPRWRGALQCYNAFVRPYLLRHQQYIDGAMRRGSEELTARTRRASQTALEWLSEKKQETVQWASAELKKAAAETIADAAASSASPPSLSSPAPKPAVSGQAGGAPLRQIEEESSSTP